MPASGQRSPPSQFRKEDGLQAAAATAAILNLSTRYRKNMEAVAGRPLATSTKVNQISLLGKVSNVVILKEKGGRASKGQTWRGELGAPVAEAASRPLQMAQDIPLSGVIQEKAACLQQIAFKSSFFSQGLSRPAKGVDV